MGRELTELDSDDCFGAFLDSDSPVMKEWMHEVRELGNEAAHPSPDGAATEPSPAGEQ